MTLILIVGLLENVYIFNRAAVPKYRAEIPRQGGQRHITRPVGVQRHALDQREEHTSQFDEPRLVFPNRQVGIVKS